MKIIVTGATGFIGTNLVISLLKNKKITKLILIDNFKSSSKKNLEIIKKYDKNKIISFIKISIISEKIKSKLIFKQHFDLIIHLAAQSSGENSFYEPKYDINTNIIGTLNIIDLAKIVKAKKIIFTSTMSV